MTLPKRVVLRPDPPKDETLHDYLLRVSHVNGYDGPQRLLYAAGLPAAAATRPCDLSRLASLLGLPDKDVLQDAACWLLPGDARHRMLGSTVVPAWAVDLVHAKVCPDCLLEGRRLPRSWTLTHVIACQRHGRELVDRCPGCGGRVRHVRHAPSRCRCGTELAREPVPAGAGALAVADALCAMLERGQPLVGHAPVPELSGALRLLRLAGASEREARARRSGTMSKPEISAWRDRIEVAAPVLVDWPGGLHELLARWAVEDEAGPRRFGVFLDRFRTALPATEFGAVHEEVRRWLGTSPSAPLVKPWSVFAPTSTPSGVVSGAEAARVLGTTSKTLSRLIGSGALHGRVRGGGRRRAYLVDGRSLAQAVRSRREAMSVQAVAHVLGIRPGRVEDLVRQGLLRDSEGPGRRRIVIPPIEVASFGERLEKLGRPAVGMPVALAEVPSLRRASLAAVLRAVFGREIVLFRVDAQAGAPVLARFGVAREDTLALRHCHAERRLGAREAGKRLGVHARMIPELVRSGCLSGDLGAGGRGVTERSVQAFYGRYVLASTIAEAGGTSTRAVARGLREAGVSPVVPTDVERGISAVWRLQDVVRVKRR